MPLFLTFFMYPGFEHVSLVCTVLSRVIEGFELFTDVRDIFFILVFPCERLRLQRGVKS